MGTGLAVKCGFHYPSQPSLPLLPLWGLFNILGSLPSLLSSDEGGLTQPPVGSWDAPGLCQEELLYFHDLRLICGYFPHLDWGKYWFPYPKKELKKKAQHSIQEDKKPNLLGELFRALLEDLIWLMGCWCPLLLISIRELESELL